jgi:hypothetical protein
MGAEITEAHRLRNQPKDCRTVPNTIGRQRSGRRAIVLSHAVTNSNTATKLSCRCRWRAGLKLIQVIILKRTTLIAPPRSAS